MITLATRNLRKLPLLMAAWTIIAVPIAVSQENTTPQLVATDAVATVPAFDVASIRLNKSGTGHPAQNRFIPNGYIAVNSPLQLIIAFAYDLRDPALERGKLIPGAPGWINSDWYDIQARMSESDIAKFSTDQAWRCVERYGPRLAAPANTYCKTVLEQRKLMLRALLADRFKLKVHRETYEAPCYALVLSKNGPENMKKSPDGATMQWDWPGRNNLTAQATPITQLAEIILSGQLECLVSDKTGLTGNYDFTLKWTRDPGSTTGFDSGGASSPDASGPSIFTAVQEQLGLKLQPTRTPTETIVIDHIEKPSDN